MNYTPRKDKHKELEQTSSASGYRCSMLNDCKTHARNICICSVRCNGGESKIIKVEYFGAGTSLISLILTLSYLDPLTARNTQAKEIPKKRLSKLVMTRARWSSALNGNRVVLFYILITMISIPSLVEMFSRNINETVMI